MPNGIYIRTEYNKPENVWKRIDKRGEDECWGLVGYKNKFGYGQIMIKCKRYSCHRLVYEQTYGIIPDEMLVCYLCDNPGCCNPRHLFLGTYKDNSQDMVSKKRSACGKKNGSVKLKEKDVLEIRELYSTGKYYQRDLGNIFNTSYSNICFIVHNKTWVGLHG